PVLIAGSTAPGEEQIVLAAYSALLERFPSLALVLAPRHLQRIHEVRRALRSAGLAYTRASETNSFGTGGEKTSVGQAASTRPQILLLDTMGELGALYQRATIAFVGGSLMPGRGGQSLSEPANAAVPVLFGPFYENHRQLGDALVAADAGSVVSDATQMVNAI